jgi:diaminohydroxyphosphoribosylaminopyrimidine deaminase / 5-amino-6-(5-phosphoribosylamino)uracil reductase
MSEQLEFTDANSAMQYAIACAKRGLGFVEPNPAVGAILVDDSGVLIAEGWHKSFGGPHAEVDCLIALAANVPDETHRRQLLESATMYVSLEPCCHTGKTGPCSQAIIQSGIRHVVVATRDPSPHVDGGGIAELKAAGISVQLGTASDDAERLIQPFLHQGRTNRPWVHAKWAMTLDGKIASRTGSSQWISNKESRDIVHQLRGRMDAVIVGSGTARIDNPTLTARPPGLRRATRIVLDSKASLPSDCNLIGSLEDGPVMVVCGDAASKQDIQRLTELGVEILQLGGVRPNIEHLLDELGTRSMTNVLVEGGGELFGSLLDQRLINEAHVFVAPKIVGGQDAVSPVAGIGSDMISSGCQLQYTETRCVGSDIYINGVVSY